MATKQASKMSVEGQKTQDGKAAESSEEEGQIVDDEDEQMELSK